MSITTVTFRTSPDHKSTRLRVPERIMNEFGDEEITGTDRERWIIERAIEKIWGKRCFWWADSGLGLHYGQVSLFTRNREKPDDDIPRRIRAV